MLLGKGFVHVYTGEGKGKTSAAIGLALRAWGRGYEICIAQFLKTQQTGEIMAFENIKERIHILRCGRTKKFTWQMTQQEKQCVCEEHNEMFITIKQLLSTKKIDILILDEVIGAINAGTFELKTLMDFIQNKPEHLEVVLTGRNAPLELISAADYVSDIACVKHPFQKGICARQGIEF